MTLLMILIALGLDHFWSQGNSWRSYNWYERYAATIEQQLGEQHPFMIGMCIIAPLLVLALILQVVVGCQWHGLPWFVLSIITLWYCLQPHQHLEDARDGIWQAHERVFAVLFWFAIGGLTGAVLYRVLTLSEQYVEARYQSTVEEWHWLWQLHGVLAWIPARLTAILFALVGDFIPGFRVVRQEALSKGKSKELLVASGLAALNLNQNIEADAEKTAIEDLVHRTIVAWIMLIALLTIGYVLL